MRTLILGIDRTGRVVQHDRSAQEILAPPSGTLLGTPLNDLVAGTPAHAGSIASLLEAANAGREAQAVLTFRAAHGNPVDTVVTVQPMRTENGASAAALAILRMPPPTVEQFLDPAIMRHALLDDTFRRIGATLDLDQMARGLINVVVPHFSNAAGLLMLESLIAADEAPAPQKDGSHLVRRLATASDEDAATWQAAFPTGEVLRYPKGTPYAECLDTGKTVFESIMTTEDAERVAEAWMRKPVAELLTGTSLLALPLNVQGSTLGFVACTRRAGFRPFDAYDAEIGMEFAARAAVYLDNGRRYSRERATALTLQRSLLPTGLSAPSSVQVRHRYLPGSQLIEVGGDWYESIALPGARVALVVGDVAGHGVRAAVTMGRLRTAIQTLAMLELPPAESLQQLNELMQVIGQREPHFATCVYATYDAVNGQMEVASAGHLPPLLVHPDGTSEFLDVAPAPPLGVGEGPIASRTFDVEDGSLLVLYTDGLVESRDRDIDDGLKRLQEIFAPDSMSADLEELAKSTLAGVYADEHRDDIAVLIAKLQRIGKDQQASWELDHEAISAGKARSLVNDVMVAWHLDSLAPLTRLLTSELVTNAIRHAHGPVTLRLIKEGTLVCEVADSSPALPRLQHVADDDEQGRGLQIVSQLAHRWGARRTTAGKVVWCELQLPAEPPKPPARPRTTAPVSKPRTPRRHAARRRKS
ncbi:MAG TPA: SpoIIE family protein phosphatase [Streptosporangiaceae bacterium]|nr:SpoIIE family protein phosphatase [Streptosporangiaceae bacterium]